MSFSNHEGSHLKVNVSPAHRPERSQPRRGGKSQHPNQTAALRKNCGLANTTHQTATSSMQRFTLPWPIGVVPLFCLSPRAEICLPMKIYVCCRRDGDWRLPRGLKRSWQAVRLHFAPSSCRSATTSFRSASTASHALLLVSPRGICQHMAYVSCWLELGILMQTQVQLEQVCQPIKDQPTHMINRTANPHSPHRSINQLMTEPINLPITKLVKLILSFYQSINQSLQLHPPAVTPLISLSIIV